MKRWRTVTCILTASLLFGLASGCKEDALPSTVDAASVSVTSWVTVEAGSANFNAISGSSADNIVIVGEGGAIMRWNGARLVRETSGVDATLRGVCVVDDKSAYAVGDKGTIVEQSGGVWKSITQTLTTAVLTAVWSDGERAVAVGEQGVVLRRDASGWSLVENAGREDLFALTGTKGAGITAVGALGMVLNLEGTALKRQPIAGFSKPLAGATTGPGGTYFVGLDGSVFRREGGGFNRIEGFPPMFLRAVTAPGPDVWVVGWDGAIARYQDGLVKTSPSVDERWLTGVYAAPGADVWIVGRSGLVMHGRPALDDAMGDGGGDARLEGGVP